MLIQRHEPINTARAQSIHLSKRRLTFKDLKDRWSKVLYLGVSGLGLVIPFNIGPVASGKITELGTGPTKEEVDSLFQYISTNS